MRALVILDTTVPDTGLAFLLCPSVPPNGLESHLGAVLQMAALFSLLTPT